jgi:predicted GTPase
MFNCIIMGAAGRDFHNFRSFFLNNPQFKVCAFTATQIPFIAQRNYPRELAGHLYDADIPIYEEEQLPRLIHQLDIQFVFFAYSDLPHKDVMHKASIVQACGASFVLLGPDQTALHSSKPVVAITATRTGTGKSPLTQWLARSLVDRGIRVSVLRHPMPYGNLKRQAVQRFATQDDLDRHECTIEEREEYEPYVRQGLVIFAGVDYEAVLREAEQEADIVLWDGGNNDFSFIKADLEIVVCDALRAGHGLDYYPGETNFRRADIVVINKVGGAPNADIEQILSLKAAINSSAELLQSDLEVSIDSPQLLAGKKVLIVEDGPTVTHGGMAYGAGWVAAQRWHAGEIVNPKPHAVGSIAETFALNPHLENVLPAMGYSETQRQELASTIESSEAEVLINGSPADIATLLDVSIPVAQVRYQFTPRQGIDLVQRVVQLL